MANRLGVWQIKWELEDLSFRYLQEADYKTIARQLAEKHGQENVREIFERCERMAARGELLFDGLRYRLSPSRVLTSNPVFAELLGLNDTLS